MKVLIFDSGTLINFSMNGFLYLLEDLKKSFDGKFLITRAVEYEIVDRPIGIHRFELGALRIKHLIDSGVLEMPKSVGVSAEAINPKTKQLMDIANKCVRAKGKWIKIISEAETSCLALSSELKKKGVENLIAVDERTIRILSERPQNLEKIMTRKLRSRVSISHTNIKAFEGYRYIRSSELVYVAHKKGLLRVKGKKALEAAIFATKFKGASISYDEVNELKKL